MAKIRNVKAGTARRMAKPPAFVLGLMLSAGIGGCSGEQSTGSLSLAVLPLPGFGITAPGKPVDVYTRLARLAKLCWMSPPAPLTLGYLFTAEVAPESRGGSGSIVIFEKNTSLGIKGDRGLVAYSMSLTASGDATTIGVQNGRISEGFANKMRSDVERWAAGETGCNEATPWPTQAASGDAAEAPAAKAMVTKAAAKPAP